MLKSLKWPKQLNLLQGPLIIKLLKTWLFSKYWHVQRIRSVFSHNAL